MLSGALSCGFIKDLRIIFLEKKVIGLTLRVVKKKLTEIEGVLCLLAQCSTFSQHEKLHTRSLGAVAKKCAMSKFRCDRVSLIDLSKVTKDKKPQGCMTTPPL